MSPAIKIVDQQEAAEDRQQATVSAHGQAVVTAQDTKAIGGILSENDITAR